MIEKNTFLKRKILIIILTMAVSPFLLLGQNLVSDLIDTHECRFWGIISSGNLNQTWKYIVCYQLDSLKDLSNINDDGWGIGYYLSPYANKLVSIIHRGRPKALADYRRYDFAVDELVNCMTHAAIAHIRNASSGYINIPNPHPFRRRSINRNFEMLFAHNGTIDNNILLQMIGDYSNINPYDYMYIDSDLYAIYIMKVIDSLPYLGITLCIKQAVMNISYILGLNNKEKQLNCVITNGDTLWVVRYASSNQNYFTVYYYPIFARSDKWIVASERLSPIYEPWGLIPNFYLAKFVPNEEPLLYCLLPEKNLVESVENSEFAINSKSTGEIFFKLMSSVSCKNIVQIQFILPRTQIVSLKLYGIDGRLVRVIYSGTANQGMNEISFNVEEFPSGIYFVHFKVGGETMTKKFIIKN